jgi:hypothetical protein
VKAKGSVTGSYIAHWGGGVNPWISWTNMQQLREDAIYNPDIIPSTFVTGGRARAMTNLGTGVAADGLLHGPTPDGK